MAKPNITIYDAASGETFEREMNAEEFAQWQADRAQSEVRAQAEAETKAKREVALSKLEALGLDEDDLRALGL